MGFFAVRDSLEVIAGMSRLLFGGGVSDALEVPEEAWQTVWGTAVGQLGEAMSAAWLYLGLVEEDGTVVRWLLSWQAAAGWAVLSPASDASSAVISSTVAEVLSQGEPVWCRSGALGLAEPRPWPETEGVWLLPLRDESAQYGFIAVDAPTDEVEMGFLRTASQLFSAAVATEAQRRQAAMQIKQAQKLSDISLRHIEELAGLYEISVATTGILNVHQLIGRLYEQISRLLHPDIVIVALKDERTDELEAVVAREYGQEMLLLPEGFRASVEDAGVTGWIVKNQKTLLLEDTAVEPPPVPFTRYLRMPRTWLGTPLMAQGKAIGAVIIQSYEPHQFDRRYISFIETMSLQVTLAIKSIRSFEWETKRRRAAELLQGLTANLIGKASLEDLLTHAINAIQAYIKDATNCSVSIFDSEKNTLTTMDYRYVNPKQMVHPPLTPIPLHKTHFARQVIEEKRTVIVEETLECDEREFIKGLSPDGVRSFIYMPIIIHEEPLGILHLDFWQKPRRFSDDEISFCRTITNYMALTISNINLNHADIQRRKEAEILHRLTAQLNRTMSIDEIFNSAIEAVRRYMPDADVCVINLMDEHGEYLTPTALWTAHPIYVMSSLGTPIPIAETQIAYTTIKEERTMVYEDIQEIVMSKPRLAWIMEKGLRAVVYLPLMVQGRAIGLLNINFWYKPRPFEPEEIVICESIANHVGIAIENARLYEAEAKRRREVEILYNLTASLIQTVDVDDILERAVQFTFQYFDGLSYCGVSSFDHDGQYLIPRQYIIAEDFDIPETFRVPVRLEETTACWLCFSERRSIVYADAVGQLEKTNERGQALLDSGLKSFLYVPMLYKNEPVGILHLNVWGEKRTFTADEIRLCEGIANQVAVALENARLYEALERRVKRLSVFSEVALITATASNMDTLLSQTTAVIVDKLYPEHFGFLMVDESGQYLIPHSSYYQQGVRERRHVRLDDFVPSIAAYVIKTGETYLSNNIEDDLYYLTNDGQTLSELTVPLRLGERIIGLINVESHQKDAFTKEDVNFVTTLAGMMSTAVERTSLYEESQFYATQLEDKVALRTAELQAERDRVEAILDSAGEGILFTDPNGVILYANPTMSAQSGYVKQELIGSDLGLLNDGSDNSPYSQMWLAIQQGERWRGELTNRRKDGTTYSVFVTVAPLHDGRDQSITGFVSVQSDITHYKEVERLKSEFVTNVSHELRTPLTNIKTYVTLLDRGRAEKQAHYKEVLQRETDRLTRLIQDLLDLSRLDTGAVKTTFAPLDVAEVVDELLQNFKYKAEAKQINLAVEIPSQLPAAWADHDQILQVLTNLLGNAIAYTPNHGRIWLTAEIQTPYYQEADERMLCIAVRDNGLGISEQDQQHLFERFYRGMAASDSRAPGTGLGLAISKEIIDRHNGYIELDTAVGEGSTFRICLPIATAS